MTVELHPFIEKMLEGSRGAPALSAGTPQEARSIVSGARAALGAGRDMLSVREIEVPTRGGDLRSRLLLPNSSPRGVIVYVHGGGWVVGSIDDYEVLGRELAASTGCAVLLPEYRLAPEHPFPAALEDVEDVLEWSTASLPELLEIDVPLIAAGDSAGANLLTVAARRLRDSVHLALQVLIYPVVDSDFQRGSYLSFAEGLPLTRRDMKWFFAQYVAAERYADPDISPLRASDLSALPATTIVVAEADVLRDDGVAYAARLEAAGVPTKLREYQGMTHGFLRLHNHIDVARAAISDIVADVEAALRAP